jgi:hypothetical protein
MKEPKKIPLNPETPQVASVEKIPMPSIYPEPMKDDVFKNEGGAEQAFNNFIQKAKASKRKYEEERLKKENE